MPVALPPVPPAPAAAPPAPVEPALPPVPTHRGQPPTPAPPLVPPVPVPVPVLPASTFRLLLSTAQESANRTTGSQPRCRMCLLDSKCHAHCCFPFVPPEGLPVSKMPTLRRNIPLEFPRLGRITGAGRATPSRPPRPRRPAREPARARATAQPPRTCVRPSRWPRSADTASAPRPT